MPPQQTGRPHPLPDRANDLWALYREAEAHSDNARILVTLCGFLGCRISEALTVTGADIDLEDKWVSVFGKGDKWRQVPLTDDLIDMLGPRVHQEGRLVTFSERHARRVITQLGEAAGIGRPISSHDLRHTAGSNWFAASRDIRVVQELLGHADVRTTQLYTGIKEDSLRETVEAAATKGSDT